MDCRNDTDALRLLRANEVSNLLGVSVWTIGNWVRRGLFPKPVFCNDHSPARFRFRDVEAWLTKRQTARRKVKRRGRLVQDGYR